MKNALYVLIHASRTRKGGIAGIQRLQQQRLSEMIAFARKNSNYYKNLYRLLPDEIEDIRMLPVTDKKTLMNHFNDWVTDSQIRLDDVRSFTKNLDNIGNMYHGKYMVANTSGTTGKHGLFLKDKNDISVSLALDFKEVISQVGVRSFLRLLTGRMACVVATGGPFMAVSGYKYIKKKNKFLKTEVFSVHDPINQLVPQLNKFKPDILIGYGTVVSRLAEEQERGNLKIKPAIVFPGGETLSQEVYKQISKTFHAKVFDVYGCTECTFLCGTKCQYGWYHVNSEWAIVEPVDSHYQPVKAGEQSHTVLITNLVNRIQPIIRYDLGDSILMREGRCECGNIHPAIRVNGRSADVLNFIDESGKQISILPLLLVTIIDSVPGVKMHQIVQTSSKSMRIRLICSSNYVPDDVWQMVQLKITHFLNENNLKDVTVERGEEPPQQSTGGKFRTVIPLG